MKKQNMLFDGATLSVVEQESIVVEKNKFIDVNDENGALRVLDQMYGACKGSAEIIGNYFENITGGASAIWR